MGYTVFLHSRAQKELVKIKGKEYQNITDELKFLEKNPRPIGCLKLTNKEGYRIRVGNFRVLYTVDESVKEIDVYRICHRKDAYR